MSTQAKVLLAPADIEAAWRTSHELFAPQMALKVVAELLEPSSSGREHVDCDEMAALLSILAGHLDAVTNRVIDSSERLYSQMRAQAGL